MPSSTPQDPSDLLLRLYAMAHEHAIDAFQDDALRLLQTVLPFDSAMWGTARTTAAGIDIHTLHLFEQGTDMMAEYEQVKHLDTAAANLMDRRRGTVRVHAPTWPRHGEHRRLGDHMKRWGLNNNFITADNDTDRRFVHWISLFRADPEAEAQAHETAFVHQIAPHVMQALAINRRMHLREVHPAGPPPCGTAIADLRGVIYHADEPFKAMLRTEWPGWPGQVVPTAALDVFLRGQACHAGRTVVIRHHARHGLLFLRCRPRCAADGLTPSELRVAELTAQGNSYKEVAARLGRSPATVRNQLRAAYDKLGVSNVAQLIDALRRLE